MAWWHDRRAAHRAVLARRLYAAGLKNKYKPNGNAVEVIGLVSGSFTHITTDSVPGTLTQTIFDTTSRADSAQILLTNSTGASKVIISAWIRGKPVTRHSGIGVTGSAPASYGSGNTSTTGFGGGGYTQGFIHDKYVDYEAQARDGDITFETGNNFVVTVDQVNKLADYYWKLNRIKKHIYTLSLMGFQSWYEPGEWYTLQIGGAGEAEYIDSTVECFDVRCSIAAGGAPYTSVSFREVEESWKFDSNETARMIASGGFNRRPSQSVVTVAAQYYSGYADYYCDGTADQTEINAAITYLNQAGGGTVHLAKGNYNTTSAITMLDGIRLEGEGPASCIVKNCNDYAITAVGTSTTSVTDITLAAIKVTRSSSDTNVASLVYYNYVDDSNFDNVTVEDSYSHGIYLNNCDGVSVGPNVKILDAASEGLKLVQSVGIIAAGMFVSGCNYGYGCWPSLGTDLVVRGDCESTSPPMLDGEATALTGNCTWARDSGQYHGGSYSYKMTASSQNETTVYLVDALTGGDAHGITGGKSYLFGAWVYLASSMSNLLQLRVYAGPPGTTYYKYVPIVQNVWQYVSMIVTPTAGTNTAYAFFYSSLMASSATCYIDDISFYEFDETNSGCQLVNSYFTGNDYATRIFNNRVLIQNNQVTDNASAGIVIDTGTGNIVTGNRCYNNGADTGLANTNGDNFHDGGTDTQWAG